jgi:hypothetical protein
MHYDGSGKLTEAIADLFGVSLKNQTRIAKLIKEAKDGLNITSESKRLSKDVKLAIYRWHSDRLNPVQDVKQSIAVQDNDELEGSVYDFEQVHFAVTIAHQGKPKRTTIMLEGYLIKALQRKHGLRDNTAIRIWIEQAIKEADCKFDSYAPLTRQVKRIIIESFV